MTYQCTVMLFTVEQFFTHFFTPTANSLPTSDAFSAQKEKEIIAALSTELVSKGVRVKYFYTHH